MSQKIKNYSGIIAVATVWLSIGVSIALAHLNILDDVPISSLGVDHRTRLLFNISLVIAAVSFSVYALHIHKFLKSSVAAPAVLIAGQIGQMLVAAAPYNGAGYIRYVHVIAAYVLALSMPISMGIYAYSARDKNYASLNKKFFWAEMLLVAAGLGSFIFASAAGALSEIVVALAFDLWVLSLSVKYIRTHPKP